jgi:hypothetical protein
MAQFDLKKASIFLVDGYSKTNARVNNASGYAQNTTTMVVDSISGIIPVGASFRFQDTGHDSIYTVTAHSETLGNTTSITFTPGLAAAVIDNQLFDFGGRRLEIKIGDGNLTYDEKRTMEYKKDRGRLDTVREGDQEPIDVRLDIRWDWLSSAGSDTVPTPEEVLKNEGLASTWTSSATDTCEPYAVDIQVVYDPDCATEDGEMITLQDYRWESLNHDLKAGTLATSGKCNVTKAVKERVTLS